VLGNACQALDRLTEALAAYDSALASNASRADIWCARGAALKKSGRLAAALDSYERALALWPDYLQAELFRAHALRALGRRDAALASYGRAAALGADPADVGFALAALGAAPPPPAAPAGYVKNLFDQYAGHFEPHLVDALGYRTPALLGALLGAHLPPAPRLAAALDLGCGTGLCGPVLRPLATQLAGVDLSRRMLDGAAAGGLYDHLACADIGAFLEGEDAARDLVAAADVLVYFGELDRLFAQVARALRPGGWFTFSCEALEDAADAFTHTAAADAGYAMRPSNRYAHAAPYLAACAAAAGFTTVETRRDVLRRDHDADVIGHLVLLRRG
jgi:predicted TPR repeat methyltransferase